MLIYIIGKPKSEDLKKEEKVIVLPVDPPITPAVVMEQSQPQIVVATAATPTTTPSTTPARTKYPKRENRKPPAHLAEAFGPALFSTPDIIRRVSTDKPPTPITPSPQLTSTPMPTPVAETPTRSKCK